MSQSHAEIVIVRRHSSEEDEHHGGAWKIAFADFMTAMMAFFLVLWIINATDKDTKTIIARYFNPVKLEEPAKAQKGIKGSPEQNTEALGDDSGAPKAEKPGPGPVQAPNPAREPAPASGAIEAKEKRAKPNSQIPPDPVKPYPTLSEEELFSDPRASLDKIAGAPPPGPRVDPSAALKGYGEVGPSMDEALRDPFRPLGSDRAIDAASPDPRTPSESPPAPTSAEPKEPGQTAPARGQPPSLLPAHGEKDAMTDKKAAEGGQMPAPSPPPTPRAQEEKASAQPSPAGPQPAVGAAPSPADPRAQEAARLMKDVQQRLGADVKAAAAPQLEIKASDEGILISLTDQQNFSMFPIGSAEPQRRVVRMMDAIAMSLGALPGRIVVRGHTDGRPYHSKTYDNWRLSAARAEMAYYMLLRGGVPEKRFDRIEGFADHSLKDPAHPLAPENRRIEILLRETNP